MEMITGLLKSVLFLNFGLFVPFLLYMLFMICSEPLDSLKKVVEEKGKTSKHVLKMLQNNELQSLVHPNTSKKYFPGDQANPLYFRSKVKWFMSAKGKVPSFLLRVLRSL